MENTKQENTKKVQQENNSQEQKPNIVQLVPPKEIMNKMAEIEKQYRKIVERENK